MDLNDSLAEPDKLTLWNVEQVILWVMKRDLEVVRGLFNQHAESEAELIRLAAAPETEHMWPSDPIVRDSLTNNNARAIKKVEAPILERVEDEMRQADLEIRLRFQAGDLRVSGRINGQGDHVEIADIAWTDLRLSHCISEGQVCAVGARPGDDWPRYTDLQIRCEEVMRVFPADDEAEASEVLQPERAEGSANVANCQEAELASDDHDEVDRTSTPTEIEPVAVDEMATDAPRPVEEKPQSKQGRKKIEGCIKDGFARLHSEPTVRPVHIDNPDMPGPWFCYFLTADEVEQIAVVGDITLTSDLERRLQQAVARFLKCQSGKHFPTPSESKRELQRLSKIFEKAAEAIEGVDLSDLVTEGRAYAIAGHIGRVALHEDMKKIAPRFKRKKSVAKAVSMLTRLRAVAAPWSDTSDIDARMSHDIIYIIQGQERRCTARLGSGILAALRRLASCATQGARAVVAGKLAGEWPRLNLIRDLYEIYHDGGGRHRLTFNSAENRYSGKFLDFILATLHLLEIPMTNQQVGNAIKKAIRS